VLQAEAALEGVQGHIDGYVESLEFEQAEHEAAKTRLDTIRRLLKECGAGSVSELLDAAKDTRAMLARWERLAGAQLCSVSVSCARRRIMYYLWL
jgi:DNA repair ATPase RecN